MNVRRFSVPSASSVCRISSGLLTSTISPGPRLSIVFILGRGFSGLELIDRSVIRLQVSKAGRDQPCEQEHQRRLSVKYGSDQLFPHLHTESQRTPHGFFEDGDFSKVIRMAPIGSRSRGKERYIAGAKPAFFAFVIGHEATTGDHNDDFVLVVMPLVAPGAAFPDDNICRPVTGSAQHLAARFDLVTYHPLGRN